MSPADLYIESQMSHLYILQDFIYESFKSWAKCLEMSNYDIDMLENVYHVITSSYVDMFCLK